MSNTETQIESGTRVKITFGAGYGSEEGTVVEAKTSEWGTQFKILLDNGSEEWTSEIRKKGQRTVNGSPIGTTLLD